MAEEVILDDDANGGLQMDVINITSGKVCRHSHSDHLLEKNYLRDGGINPET